MNHYTYRILIFVTTILSFEKVFADTSVHWGVAKDGSGKIVYTEKHFVTKKAGVLKNTKTEYYDKNRKVTIGVLNSDYSKNLLMPTYEFRDFRTGYREGLRFSNSNYMIYYKNTDGEESAKKLKEGESIFSCQGWHYYLIQNLSKLEKQELELKLILPSKLDFYSFKIKKAETNGNQIVAHLELSNWFLSVFAPKLRLVYDKTLKKLIEYQGISNIMDKNGDNQEVNIHYEY